MPLRMKPFGCQCSHPWISCVTSSLLRKLFPPRCSFRGPERWQSDGARSGLYGGCGRMFHFSFRMVSIVRAATCGRALSWKNGTDVCARFLLFLMFLSSTEGVVWLFFFTLPSLMFSIRDNSLTVIHLFSRRHDQSSRLLWKSSAGAHKVYSPPLPFLF